MITAIDLVRSFRNSTFMLKKTALVSNMFHGIKVEAFLGIWLTCILCCFFAKKHGQCYCAPVTQLYQNNPAARKQSATGRTFKQPRLEDGKAVDSLRTLIEH